MAPHLIIGGDRCGGDEALDRAHGEALNQVYCDQVRRGGEVLHGGRNLKRFVGTPEVMTTEGGWSSSCPSLCRDVAVQHVEGVTTTAKFSRELMRTVLNSTVKMFRGKGLMSIHEMDVGVTGHEELNLDQYADVFDEVTGVKLPPELVKKARTEEIQFLHSFPVYRKIKKAEAGDAEFVQVRWVDVNKGDLSRFEVRSRLVAKDFKFKNPDMVGTFAATPPVEAFRFMLSILVSRIRRQHLVIDMVMSVMDVSRAHFHPFAKRRVCIRLPKEDQLAGEEDLVGLLLRAMYGTRDAANAFEGFANEVMEAFGFSVGKTSPCIYSHKAKLVWSWRHGDDYCIVGERSSVLEVETHLHSKMIIKRKWLLGWKPEDDKMASILNRLITLESENGRTSVVLEPDPRHIDLLVRMFHLDKDNAKGVVTPSDKQAAYADETTLVGDSVVQYRSGTMRANYIGPDLPQIQYTVNKCSRGMAMPTKGGLLRLKRLSRYLIHDRRVVQVFHEQEVPTNLKVRSDSDWAGYVPDRKSVGCLQIFWGGHLLRASVATQSVQALSSGEAEFVACVRGGSFGIGCKSMIEDFGFEVKYIELGTDSTASKGMCGRAGLGRIRHLDTGLLWLQHWVEAGIIRLRKVLGTKNTADLGTKELSNREIWTLLAAMGFEKRTGRHPLALELTV